MALKVNCSLVNNQEQIEACYAVMSELRPQYSQVQFLENVLLQQQQGYQLVQAIVANQVVAVAGFVLGNKLAWGRHIYIDDFVVANDHRSLGIGAYLMDWMIDFAKVNQCESIHLDSGVQRFAAHKFYLKENFSIASHHFSIKL